MLSAILEKPGARLREWVLLAKPGIVLGNMVSFAGGFLLASMGRIDSALFAASGCGVALVMASGCVFNNYIDRDIDRKMERTRGRPLVTDRISPSAALGVGAALGILGFALLAATGKELVVAVVLAGYLNYVIAYSLYWKRNSVHGTLVGSLSGATAPVAGYCAVRGRIDLEAVLLLVIFCLWQMPHAYAIAIARLRDYTLACIPVLPVQRGIPATQRQIIAFIVAFLAAALALGLLRYAGWAYCVVTVAVGGYWLRLAWAGRGASDQRSWARGVFACSLLMVTTLSVMMAVDYSAHPVPAASGGRLLVRTY